ncbi:hypothetical protein KPH14_010175 [Odynerus spinipes]|uniref:Uncharacterized protein n=1 Tax=Odynerus spinipes TaxID=1348599 RepID=A0AAD9RU81_9HYME|nr:hypothetical protein KPH14_010175 [Odynerus spinipes]
MTKIILGLGLLALLGADHCVGGQGSKPTSPVTSSMTSSSVVRRTEGTTISALADEKEGSETVDPFQDILFDPSLIVARLNRDVSDISNKESTWSASSNDAKDEDSSNVLEDLNTQEDRYHLEPNWYRRRDWQAEEEKPTYKRESYNRFLKYPIFSGR